MMENSDSDTFDTLVFDALVSTEIGSKQLSSIQSDKGNTHKHQHAAHMQIWYVVSGPLNFKTL